MQPFIGSLRTDSLLGSDFGCFSYVNLLELNRFYIVSQKQLKKQQLNLNLGSKGQTCFLL